MYQSSQVFTLAARQAMRFCSSNTQLIRVSSGALWITREGEPRDHVVEAGQLFPLRGRGTTVVSALGNARFALLGAEEAGLALKLAEAF